MRAKEILEFLDRLKSLVLARVPAEMWDKNGTWKHWPLMMEWNFAPYDSFSKKRCKELIGHAGEFLKCFATDGRCSGKWTNIYFCPKGPLGDYIWRFQLEICQELAWMHPEFVEGFRFGVNPKDPFRDFNPYVEHPRNRSWDAGYILGLNAATVREWADLLEGSKS